MNYLARNSTSLRMILEKAQGSWLWDVTGKKYLDAFSSYSSANFGHQNTLLYQHLIRQSTKVSVFSRTLSSDILLSLCEVVYEHFHPFIVGKDLHVVPMNSGVEAGETAVKFARKWGYLSKGVAHGQAKVLFAKNNYWGKTIAAISTSDYDYNHYFYPTTPGFCKVEYDNADAIRKTLREDPTIVAVYLEPVQGEGGINVPARDYFKKVREACTSMNVLLIADEIQTGMGRTGGILCLEDYGIQADMILLGKSLGGGYLPISMCIARKEVADLVNPGEHSSTFGGYPLGCAMAKAAIELLKQSGLGEVARRREKVFQKELTLLQKRFPHLIREIRGKGMLFGIQLDSSINALEACHRLTDHGLVTREANRNVIRVCPPLTSTDSELEYMFTKLDQGLKQVATCL
jgi:ornithine--oxo-acid transaminase